jgi:hypothetical protein
VLPHLDNMVTGSIRQYHRNLARLYTEFSEWG